MFTASSLPAQPGDAERASGNNGDACDVRRSRRPSPRRRLKRHEVTDDMLQQHQHEERPAGSGRVEASSSLPVASMTAGVNHGFTLIASMPQKQVGEVVILRPCVRHREVEHGDSPRVADDDVVRAEIGVDPTGLSSRADAAMRGPGSARSRRGRDCVNRIGPTARARKTHIQIRTNGVGVDVVAVRERGLRGPQPAPRRRSRSSTSRLRPRPNPSAARRARTSEASVRQLRPVTIASSSGKTRNRPHGRQPPRAASASCTRLVIVNSRPTFRRIAATSFGRVDPRLEDLDERARDARPCRRGPGAAWRMGVPPVARVRP